MAIKWVSLGFTSPFEATAVKLLREAGADIVGKANCDEFGMGYVSCICMVVHN